MVDSTGEILRFLTALTLGVWGSLSALGVGDPWVLAGIGVTAVYVWLLRRAPEDNALLESARALAERRDSRGEGTRAG